MRMCAACSGCGEVDAGITGGIVCYGWKDELGVQASYPTWVKPNPDAVVIVQTGNKRTDYRDIYFLRVNPLVPLWGIAVCGRCHGTGLSETGGRRQTG